MVFHKTYVCHSTYHGAIVQRSWTYFSPPSTCQYHWGIHPLKQTWNLKMMVSNRNLQTSKGPPFQVPCLFWGVYLYKRQTFVAKSLTFSGLTSKFSLVTQRGSAVLRDYLTLIFGAWSGSCFFPSRWKSSWWLNQPFEKYARQIGSFPQIGVKIKNIWVTTNQKWYSWNLIFFHPKIFVSAQKPPGCPTVGILSGMRELIAIVHGCVSLLIGKSSKNI